jgi:glycosyltransferase involved in cell wall biosynthesis
MPEASFMCSQVNATLENPTVSIIVPVHNGGAKFRICLASLKACHPPPDEVIVVADGDSDGSWRYAEEFGLQALKTPETGGPARARNIGAKKVSGDLIFFLDADVTVSADAIERVKAAFRNDPELSAVIGSYDEKPFETNFLSQYKNLLHHYVHQCSSPDASTFWGACGAIRREIFSELGGFDEKYRYPSIEDIELGYRLKRKGCRILLSKQLMVKHLKHWGILSLLKADFFYRALPWTDLILNEGGFIDDLNLTISSRISVIAAYMVLVCLPAAVWFPWFVVPAAFSAMLLFWLNRDLYGFFMNKRGLGFTLKAIPWHWFYFFYSGLAFAIGYVKHQVCSLR